MRTLLVHLSDLKTVRGGRPHATVPARSDVG
jgi:hypothetical protein